MKKLTYVIIGYSLDSVIWARKLALNGEKVIYLKTGKLGYPLDDIRDYISYEDLLKIRSLDVNLEFKKLHNGTYVYIPYDQLKFVNNSNGVVSYPLNKNSFESAEEWEQIQPCITNIKKFRDELSNASNFINIYKNFFPKWLYDCMLKYIAINKWGGFRQSKFTREGIAKEIDLSYLDDTNTGTIYRPKAGFEKLCKHMLKHKNIKIENIEIEELKEFIIRRYKDKEIVLMDNRVDYICNYTYGNFDRVKFNVERVKDPNMEEFIDISEGIVLTPTKDYFCTSNEEGNIIKITSERIESLNYKEQSDISPTSYNKKLYNEYTKMMGLYSGKHLNLENVVVTRVK